MKKIHILHIITGLFPTGGTQKAIYRLLANLDQERFSSTLVTLRDKGVIGAEIEALGVPVYELGIYKSIPSFKDMRNFIDLMRFLNAPDIVQGWAYHGNFAASVARGLYAPKPPVYWNVRHTVYAMADEKWTTALLIRLSALYSSKTAGIIYNAHASVAGHQAVGFDASRKNVISNGFDVEEFVPSRVHYHMVREELGLTSETRVVGMISRFHQMKGHEYFIEAAGLVHVKHPDVHFMLVGNQVNRENELMMQWCENAGITEQVHLLDERHDIPRLAAALDLSVMASTWGEGLPNAVGEVMASGVPCVVTDIGDAAWLVGDTGRVVAPQSASALAEALDELLNMDDGARKTLGLQARLRIQENYSIEKMVQEYQNLYQAHFAQNVSRE